MHARCVTLFSCIGLRYLKATLIQALIDSGLPVLIHGILDHSGYSVLAGFNVDAMPEGHAIGYDSTGRGIALIGCGDRFGEELYEAVQTVSSAAAAGQTVHLYHYAVREKFNSRKTREDTKGFSTTCLTRFISTKKLAPGFVWIHAPWSSDNIRWTLFSPSKPASKAAAKGSASSNPAAAAGPQAGDAAVAPIPVIIGSIVTSRATHGELPEPIVPTTSNGHQTVVCVSMPLL